MALQASITKRSRVSKIHAMVNRLSIAIAKKKGNPDFSRYKKVRKKYLSLKRRMILKHRPEALMATRKLLSQQGGQKK